MSHISKIVKYQLMSLKNQTLTCFSIIALNILISFVVTHFMTSVIDGPNVTVGSIDIVALIWIFILGISFFKPSFKFILSNGVSRKKFFLANVYAFAIVSAAWSIAVTVISIIITKYVNISVLYELLYKNLNGLNTAVWMFAAFFMLAILGWFINILYYRSSKMLKLFISFTMFAIAPLLLLINVLTSGIVFKGIAQFFIITMGFSSSLPNSYIATLSMLLLAAVLCGFNFLLIRKAQIQD